MIKLRAETPYEKGTLLKSKRWGLCRVYGIYKEKVIASVIFDKNPIGSTSDAWIGLDGDEPIEWLSGERIEIISN